MSDPIKPRPFYLQKPFIVAVVTLLSIVGGYFGLSVDENGQSAIVNAIDAIAGAFASM